MGIKIHSGQRAIQIAVIGDAQVDPEVYKFAELLGEAIATSGYTLVTGGRGGIMEAVSKGAYSAGGITVGILPSSSMEEANPYCSIVIPTGLGHARNSITAISCDAIVAIGGGAGTMSEICFGWIHQKPIFTFTQFQGWSERVSGTQLDSKFQTKIESCSDIEDLMERLGKIFSRTKSE